MQTNNIDHERSTDYAAFARALAGHKDKAASLRDIADAPGDPADWRQSHRGASPAGVDLRTNVRLNRARLYVANDRPSSLNARRRPRKTCRRMAMRILPAFLGAADADFTKALLAEESLVVIFGQEYRGQSVESLIEWGLKRGNVRFAYLGDHANSRGAADMGLFPDLLPGYVPVTTPGAFGEYPGLPAAPGKTLPEMFEAAGKGELGALLLAGANPVAELAIEPIALKNTFVIVQDIFLTETAALADVVLPAASLYEKTGTVTNTFGDVQLTRKAADRAGVKPDFEILVRLAGGMGVDVKSLVPFGKGSVTADLGQSRGAQSGEADRHSVWLEANNLEPKLSPFDPMALFDEIVRLVPGFAASAPTPRSKGAGSPTSSGSSASTRSASFTAAVARPSRSAACARVFSPVSSSPRKRAR